MKVYNFFKYTGTETGKSMGVFSNLEKAMEKAIDHLHSIYGYNKTITFNKTENYFEIVNKSGQKTVDDWYAINEINVL